jgi:hypothetical protein
MSIIKEYTTEVFKLGVALGSGRSRLNSALVQLSATQIQGLFASPVTVIPAPPAGQGIVVIAASIEMTPGTNAFAGGGAVQLQYHGQSTNLLSGTLPASVVTATGSSTLTAFGAAAPANGITVALATGVDIANLTAAFTAGNGSLTLFCTYATITLM